MFEEKRGGKNGELGEKERADLCYKKLSFEVLETFVCFCCFHCCAVIKAKDRFFSTHHPSSSSSLPLCSFLFFPRLLLFSSKVHLCPRWKALYLLRSLWCLNDDMESKLFSAIPSFILFVTFSDSSNYIWLFQMSLHWQQAGQDTTEQLTLSWIKSSRRGKTCSTYQNVYRSLNYASQSWCSIWIWWSLVDLSVFSCHVFIGMQSKQFF